MRSRVETEDGTEPSAGMLVTPTIRLVRELGSGGMGTLWLADHAALKATVVVKFMSRLLASDARAQARFSREAAAASQLKSPHVAQVFDHGVTAAGLPFIVMEHLEGEDLATRLARQVWLPAEEVVAIVDQIAKALMRAEAKGIVHRDVKPENIFLVDVGGDVFAKLVDFGIARAEEPGDLRMTDTGAAIGTPFYMSPEQIVGARSIDHRSDVWSLGIVAIEALTGRRPFRGDTHGAVAIAINSAPLPVLSVIDPARFTPAADAWVERACARDLNERFPTARDLARGLSAALEVPAARAPFASVPDESAGRLSAGDQVVREQLRTAPITFSNADGTGRSRRVSGPRLAMISGVAVAVLGTIGVASWSRGTKTEPPLGLPIDAIATAAPLRASATAAPPVSPAAAPVAATATASHAERTASPGVKPTAREGRTARDAGAKVTTKAVETSDDDALK